MLSRLGLCIAVAALALALPASATAAAHRPLSPRLPQPHVPGYLGIGFHDATGRGVEVVMVDHDGPAGKAGLRTHDILLTLNGQSIPNADALSRMIHESGPGTNIALAVLRDGKSTNVVVQLADRAEIERAVRARVAAADPPESGADPPVNTFVDPRPEATPQGRLPAHGQSFFSSVLHTAPFTGLGLQTMEPQLAEFFGDSHGFGLLVQMVVPNSPAAFAGLRAGDVLLRADTVALRSPSDWTRHLHGSVGEPVLLNVLRDKHEIVVRLVPESHHHSLLEWPHFGPGIQ